MTKVVASAPTRIDLAGGTVDIWPLYLLTSGALTVNAAIDLRARCVAASRRDGRLVIVSRDQRRRTEVPIAAPVRPGQTLELLVRIARRFAPSRGATIETECVAPAGSGLGGSSSLAVATAAALCRLSERRVSRRQLLALVRDLETQVLGIPAGEQDYFAALYGGMQAIDWRPGGGERTTIDTDTATLRRHTVLCYSGASRSSGTSNWDMMKRRIDGERAVTGALEGVVAQAGALREALVRGDWEKAGRALGREMHHRRRLSPLVASGPVPALLEAGRRAGAWGGKVCGAGGGGCLVFLSPARRVGEVEEALARAGARPLGFQFARGGATARSMATSRVTGAQ